MKQEHLKTIVSSHWVKYVAPLVVWCALVIVSIWIFLLAGTAAYHAESVSDASFLFACTLLLTAQHILFYYLLGDALGEVLVTSKRVIAFKTTLFLSDDIMEIPLDKIRIVNAEKRGVLQNLLNYGSLHFDGQGIIERVPHPHRMARSIAQILDMK